MPRMQSVTIDGDQPQQHNVSVSGVLGHHVGRALYIVPSALAWLLLPIVGYFLHRTWGGPLPAAGVAAAGCIPAAVAVITNRHRSLAAHVLPPLGILTLTLWLAAVSWAGLHSWLMFLWFVFGLAVCAAWNIHGHRHRTGRQDSGGHGDLHQLFAGDAQLAGLKGLKVLPGTVEISPHSASGEGTMPAGQMLAADLAKQTQLIESAAKVLPEGGLPPGSIQIRPHEDDSRRFKFTISDPRILNRPLPYPFLGQGSLPGASIAEPISLGRWQDSEYIKYRITGHHLQGMGATGAGKTMGLMYNEIGETVTRYDAAVVAFDVTKRLQFVGPLEPCLHLMVIEDDQALDVLGRLHRARLARTDWLGGLRLSKWEKGCGLTHITAYLAEVPDIWSLVDKADMDEGDAMDQLLSDVKAMRSAGIRLVFDLQRSDWTQQPTLARGQLAKMCFGVLDEGDAAFGLSAAQQNAECHPEIWGTRYPGKLFLDAPTIPEKYITMPGRAWFWGENSDLIAQHAAAFPASARPMDHITSPILMGTPGVELEVTVPKPAGWRASAAILDRPSSRPVPPSAPAPRESVRLRSMPTGQNVENPDEDLEEDADVIDDGLPVEVPDNMKGVRLGPDPVPEGSRLAPAQARAVFRTQLEEWFLAGKTRFSIEDLMDHDVDDRATRSRGWLYDEARAAVDEGYARSLGGFPEQWEITLAA